MRRDDPTTCSVLENKQGPVDDPFRSLDGVREMTGVSSKETFPINSGPSDEMEAVRESGGPNRDEQESLPVNDDAREMGAEGGPSSSP